MNNKLKESILIIEDERDIAELIQVHLTELDLHTEICNDGEQGMQLALNNDYSLVILDIMLPRINGLDICRQLRSLKPLQAILMLTSRISETDRVLGLELGADDYMTKPFSIRELQARVRAQLRRVHCIEQSTQASLINARLASEDTRHTQPTNGLLHHDSYQANSRQQETRVESSRATCVGKLIIDHVYHQVKYKENTIELTSTEFELLSYLSSHPDQVFSRSQLLDSVWGYHHCGYEHTVNSHINRLRNKLERDTANPIIIQTVWGVGYKLNSAGVS
jgi:DNA-binding response OmpR family regulator